MKWAIREAIDVYFKAKHPLKLGARTIRAGEPIMVFDTVQTSAFEVAAEISYVTGGRGNSRILSFEGDKTLTFNFEDALLSNEGLAILAGADLIPARNNRLPGSSPEARSVVAHFTEKHAVITNNISDVDDTNQYPFDPSLFSAGQATTTGDYSPRGGRLNVWLTKKPFVGQNASIYVALLNNSGEMSGAPIEINLRNPCQPVTTTPTVSEDQVFRRSHLAVWNSGEAFIAVDSAGNPMRHNQNADVRYRHPCSPDGNAVFDDQVAHYVDVGSMANNWVGAWGDITDYIRYITAPNFGAQWGSVHGGNAIIPAAGSVRDHFRQQVRDPNTGDHVQTSVDMYHPPGTGTQFLSYSYLLAPSGGVAQPKAFREGSRYVYKVNVPSILFQDIVHLDFYVEHRRNATQISILPDKFGPFVYVEGASLVRRASDGMDLPVNFVIPKFKITTALTFTMAATGDASTFNFQGDAYPDFSKFDLTRRVLADIQVIDEHAIGMEADPTDYRRFRYAENGDEYLWKDPSMQPHSNIDYADTITYDPTHGGPATRTPGAGLVSTAATFTGQGQIPNNPRGQGIIEECYVTPAGSRTILRSNEEHALQSNVEGTLTTNHDADGLPQIDLDAD